MDLRFSLRNYKGSPTAFYFVETKDIAADATATQADPTHHIFVVDASGSMWCDMESLRGTIEKLLTLEEYKDADTLISLISYASNGDIKTHFTRTRVGDINTPGSAYVEEIRKLRSRGLTCMSQGLRKAGELVRDGELTCISLHSDGYANDRSPTAERREIEIILKDFEGKSNVFINTIAYRSWSDFKFLSSIANALSGTCIQAQNIKQVYDALHNTTSLLTGKQAPAVQSEIDDFDYQVFLSSSARKINGANTYLAVRGLAPTDDKRVYRYKRVDQAEYDASTLPVCGEGSAALGPVTAFSRAQLAEGNINASKFAMVALRDATLLDIHAKALTNEEIAAMSNELETILFNGIPSNHVRTTDYGLDTSRASVLRILGILGNHGGQISVDLKELAGHYQKRGVKRLAGVRQDDGSIEKPWLDTVYKEDNGSFAKATSFDVNRNSATINMQVVRPINLVNRSSGEVISKVSSVDVNNLSAFNNYTIVGDGSLNMDHMVCKIHSKKLHRELVDVGALTGDYDPDAIYTISFEGRPLVEYDATYTNLDGVFQQVTCFKVLESMFGALLKATSVDYTDDQMAELKKHYLSAALYVNFPTTNEYTSLDDALAQGVLDTRLSYKVDIGSKKILNAGKLHSANKYMARRFAVTSDGVDPKKPTMMAWWNDDFVVEHKQLNARTKLDAVDELMMPFYDEFMGTGTAAASVIQPVLKAAGLDDSKVSKFISLISGSLDKDEAVDLLTEARKAVKYAAERLYRDKVSPVVFYIGSTGLLPDEFETRALTAEHIIEKYPTLKLSKAEKEGTFFEVGDTIITVYIKGEYFSTGRGAAAAAAK